MEDGIHGSNSCVTDPQDELINMKAIFNEKMKEYSNKNEDVVKKPWTSASIEDAIREILDSNNPEKKKTSRQYRLTRKYDTMEVGDKRVLIKKMRSNEDPIVVIIPVEEFFDILLQYHRATGHGGRDKMLFALKNKFYVPKPAIEIFLSLCKMCNMKKCQQHRNIVVRPITTKDFNLRSQVDLIDFQSTPCDEYKWLMNYQDHSTKFCLLRPLKTKCATDVAMELLKIFLDFGAPHILQSDNGREFTADVIKELVHMWPDCKIVHGRPRHPQSQGSIERCNQDIENMLRAWMNDNGSTDWAMGCRYVQWQKNTSKHRVIGRSPYTALFGTEAKLGLKSTNIPSEILDKIESEEDLERFKEDKKEREISNEEEESEIASIEIDLCFICSEILEETTTVLCSSCSLKVHATCCKSVASSSKDNNCSYLCDICNRQENITTERQNAHAGQKRQAEKMIETTRKKLKPVTVGEFILLNVPKVDRGPLDCPNLIGKILKIQNNVYQIGTKGGIIKTWFSRSDFQISGAQILEDIPEKSISVRQAVAYESKFGGQGYNTCKCSVSKIRCQTKKCLCKKANQLCSSKCHKSAPCGNK